MKYTKYLKSCFIAFIISLLYIIFVTRFIDDIAEDSGIFVILSTSLIFISGVLSPLTFLMSGKYTTARKEAARPDIPESSHSASGGETQSPHSENPTVFNKKNDYDNKESGAGYSENDISLIPGSKANAINGRKGRGYSGINIKVRGPVHPGTSQDADIESINPGVATPEELAVIRQKNRVKVIKPAKKDDAPEP